MKMGRMAMGAALGGLWLATAHAELIVNGDFEMDGLAGNATSAAITGWGTFLYDTTSDNGEVPESPNTVVRLTGNKSMQQDVVVSWTSTNAFTLSFNACEVWWKSAAAGNNLWVMIRNPTDNTKFFSKLIALDGTHGGSGATYPTWQTNQTFAFSFTGADLIDGTLEGAEGKAVEGQNLRIYFYTTTSSQSINWIDNVSLTGAPAVEPPGAAIKLASPFQKGMVLQRDKPVAVWGEANPTNAVSVSVGGFGASGMSDANGNWKVVLPALTSGGPYELVTVSGGETNVLTDVLVGDVWIAFGQSNMVRPLSEMTNKTPYINDIATNRMIRCLKISQAAAISPQESGAMTWLDNADPGSWTSVGAVFARQMHQASGIPTAIIWAAWGSSSIEGWMPIQMTNSFPHFDAMMQDFHANDEATVAGMLDGSIAYDDVYIRTRPNIIYNQMIHPLLNLGIAGFVWYQGEANADEPVEVAQYGFTLPAFVTEYRKLFGQGDLPYLGVQLPSYNRTYWPWFRASQNRLAALSNAFVAVTIDTGLANNIHPYDKEPIGKRLALLARKYVLGEPVEAHGPTFSSLAIDGSEVAVGFSHAEGLTTDDALAPAGFELAGSDQVWFAATSSAISGTNVVLGSSSVAAPVAVRYAWSSAPVNEVNLVNGAGLPAAPFRTDDWMPADLGAQAPQAVADAYAVLAGQTLVVPASGVLGNDMDLNRDALTASLVSGVAHGTLDLMADGSFGYTPAAGFTGNDPFTYSASDGALASAAVVTISVIPANAPTRFVDSFDNDGLAINFGEGGGMATYIPEVLKPIYFRDDGKLTGVVTSPSDGAARGAVYSMNAFTMTNGFSLDVVYDIAIVDTTIADSGTFGLVDEIGNLDGLFVDESKGITGLGMSLTTRPRSSVSRQGLNQFDADGVAFTNLSNAQVVANGIGKTFNLTVWADGTFSYSIDGAPATTGTTTLDLSRSYHFAAYTQRNAQFAIESVSLAPIAPVTAIGKISAAILPGDRRMEFSWNGAVGASYLLETTADLVDGPWVVVTNVLGRGGAVAIAEELDKSNAFYRVSLAE